jgi:hypothetical protein
VARYFAVAFIAPSHGIGMDYARKKYGEVPVVSLGWTSRVRSSRTWRTSVSSRS